MPITRNDLETERLADFLAARIGSTNANGLRWMRLVRPGARRTLVGIAAVALLIAGTLAFWPGGGATGSPSSRRDLGLAETETATAGPASPLLTVHVAGAVARPGVYSIRDGSRVVDALTAAGGVVEGADLAAVNLAAQVVDASQVLVPRVGESPASGGATGTPVGPRGRVNINTASDRDLDALPGIGPATAARIVAFRKEHGRFRSVDDLSKVSGIGDARVAALRPLVTV